MIPGTLTGLLVFLASVGPGYAYVQIVERYRPIRERTPLREASQIVVSGALCTIAGVVVALTVVRVRGLVDTSMLVAHPGQYLVHHPVRAGFALLVTLTASYGLAVAVAFLMPGKGARVHADSAWYGAFERDLPDKHGIVATVELRDGRVLGGVIRSFTAEPGSVDDRELTLAATASSKMRWRTPDGKEGELPDAFVILRGADIAYVSASYMPLA